MLAREPNSWRLATSNAPIFFVTNEYAVNCYIIYLNRQNLDFLRGDKLKIDPSSGQKNYWKRQ